MIANGLRHELVAFDVLSADYSVTNVAIAHRLSVAPTELL
jgi:hypothetical protein